MAKMQSSHAIQFAKEVTIKAIEAGILPMGNDAKETAQNVVDFYNVISDSLSTGTN